MSSLQRVVLLAALFLGFVVPASAQTGPGGVGNADGSASNGFVQPQNAIWLSADEYDGSTWGDISGNDSDGTARLRIPILGGLEINIGADSPTSLSGVINGRPVVRFDGNDDGLILSGSEVTGIPNGNHTLIIVSSRNGSGEDQTLLNFQNTDASTTRTLQYNTNPPGNPGGTFDLVSIGPGDPAARTNDVSTSDFNIITSTVDGVGSGSERIDLAVNGDTKADEQNPGTFDAFAGALGFQREPTGFFGLGSNLIKFGNGSIAEVIAYSDALNQAQRVLVENYLSAKYDISLNTGNGATDVYAGDDSGNGDYDRGVFGIGRASASDTHQAGEADGLRFDAPNGLDDGDYLMAGHKEPATDDPGSQVTTQNVSAPVEQRLVRVWFVSRTDPGSDLTTDVTFEVSTLSGDPSNYVLLEQSTAGTGTFSAKITGADVTTDNRVTFTNVDLTDGSGITLGTTNETVSPLAGVAITVVGTDGNEGDATTGELGGDAGWRLIGPPVRGARAGDLISGSDTNGSVVEFSLAEGAMFYRWDDTAGQGGDWTAVPASTAPFQNGRGYLLFLFDDEGTPNADPLNPSITLDLQTGTVPPSDVTVSSLNQNADFHVLANPFNGPFDLTSLEQGMSSLGSGNTDFSATVQIWDGGATTAEGSAQVGAFVDVAANEADNRGAANMATTGLFDGDIISAWQGFVVERTNTGGGTATQLTFTTAGRTDGTRSIIGSKSRRSAEPAFAHIGLKLTVDDNGGQQVARDEAASLYFHPNATEGWDAFDASKLEPLTSRYAVFGPVGTGKEDRVAMKAVESRPMDAESPLTIPFQLRTKGSVRGTATVTTDGWKGVRSDWTVTLVDTKATADTTDDEETTLGPHSKYRFNLPNPATSKTSRGDAVDTKAGRSQTAKRTPGGPLPIRTLAPGTVSDSPGRTSRRVSSTKAVGDSGPYRFRLRIESEGETLPVDMADFRAQNTGRRVALEWETISETNNAGFYVEHRRLRTNAAGDTVQAGSWNRLGFVEGTGTTDEPQDYRYKSGPLDYGPHVFRLRQVDTDGSMSLSDEVQADIRLNRAYNVSAPYPHPVRRATTVDLTVRKTQEVAVEVYDVLGRRIAVPFDEEIRGQQTRSVKIDASRFASGVYFLRIRGNGFRTTERMTVVH